MNDPHEKRTVPAVTSGYGVTIAPVRWEPYKEGSHQFSIDVLGRWQTQTDYGKWRNTDRPEFLVQDVEALREAISAEGKV